MTSLSNKETDGMLREAPAHEQLWTELGFPGIPGVTGGRWWGAESRYKQTSLAFSFFILAHI